MMDTQKLKASLIILIAVIAIGGIIFFTLDRFYKPELEKKIKQEYMQTKRPVSVVVAARDIAVGSVITREDVINMDVPSSNIIGVGDSQAGDYERINSMVIRDAAEVVGKVARTNIYINEQIVSDKIGDVGIDTQTTQEPGEPKALKVEQSDRYITVDIPNYNFVNGSVHKGSLVDILVDKGNGKYDVVLSKVVIYDKKIVVSGEEAKKDPSLQPSRPAPKAPDRQGGVPGPGDNSPLQNEDNPALIETNDYRVTLMVNEKEHKRIFEAMTYGKLMTRLYVLPTQEASTHTFSSAEEKKVNYSVTKKESDAAENTNTNTTQNSGTGSQTNQSSNVPTGD